MGNENRWPDDHFTFDYLKRCARCKKTNIVVYRQNNEYIAKCNDCGFHTLSVPGNKLRDAILSWNSPNDLKPIKDVAENATTAEIDEDGYPLDADDLTHEEMEAIANNQYPQAQDEDDQIIDWEKLKNEGGTIQAVNNFVAPMPCVRDEHGEIKEQSVIKLLIGKINEELDELKEAVFMFNDRKWVWSIETVDGYKTAVAEEAADTITAITTMLEALGIDAEMRDEAQRRVNAKNRERGRL